MSRFLFGLGFGLAICGKPVAVFLLLGLAVWWASGITWTVR